MTSLPPRAFRLNESLPVTHEPSLSLARFEEAMRILTGKWKGDILQHLSAGKRRFGELMRAMPGVTQHMLTVQLRDLEHHALVTRTVYPEVPPRVEYGLTPAARELRGVLQGVIDWLDLHGDGLNLAAQGAEADDELPRRGAARRRAGGAAAQEGPRPGIGTIDLGNRRPATRSEPSRPRGRT